MMIHPDNTRWNKLGEEVRVRYLAQIVSKRVKYKHLEE